MKNYRSVHLMEAVCLISLGVLTLILPHFYTFRLENMLGIVFMAAGLIQFVPVFLERIQGQTILYFLIALLHLLFGIIFWIHPIVSLLSLGLILMEFLIADGIAKLLLGYQSYRSNLWFAFLLCGVASIGMAVAIWIEWPVTSAVARGFFGGASLILYGSCLLGRGKLEKVGEHHRQAG
jgi:uncharacterized membrane protein HdeD (DUF308 family)